ncbi:synaptogyrin-1-like, partial [Sander vitreus]
HFCISASTSIHFATPFIHLLVLFAFLSSSITNRSIPKAGQSFLGFQRYKLGADSALFSQEYTDPSQDVAGAPYTSFGGDDLESPGGGAVGQANSDGAFDGTGGYQRQDY